MSIFGNIVSAIFGPRKAAGETAPGTAATAAAGGAAGPAPTAAAVAEAERPAPMTREQVEAMIQKIATDTGHQDYNWRQSIVDLMKLLNLDSSLAARKQLAQELGYTGALDGSAEMNVWLHKRVMTELMASGGTVPDRLK